MDIERGGTLLWCADDSSLVMSTSIGLTEAHKVSAPTAQHLMKRSPICMALRTICATLLAWSFFIRL